MNNYKGVFKKEIEDFIKYKNSNGYYYNSLQQKLKKFDKYTIENQVKKIFNKELVTKFVESHKECKSTTINGYASLMRQFATYLNMIGINAYVIPIGIYQEKRNFKPYIYTEEETIKIFNSIDNGYLKANSKKQQQIRLIFELLFSTGVRIGEALNIKKEDINYKKMSIELKNTKNGSDRLILVSEKLINKMQSFDKKYSSDFEYFFEKNIRQKYSTNDFYAIFRKVLFNAKIMHTEFGPRVHDIRHTFAVNSFKQAISEGKEVNLFLPILSTYLGHTELESTYRYLHLIYELFPDIREKTKDILKIDKVINYDEF